MERRFLFKTIVMNASKYICHTLCLFILVIMLVTMLPINPASADSPLEFSTLQPGEPLVIYHQVPVNVVFVGFDQGIAPWQIDETLFSQIMPQFSVPYIMDPVFTKEYQGLIYFPIVYLYDPQIIFANQDFTDSFFGYLSSAAVPKPVTEYQELYNTQLSRSLTIDENYWIDATSVETWLAQNAYSMLGTDTSQYTIFFINWYGRNDFKFHVYTKDGPPDPDTGNNIWLESEEHRLIAWGGSTDLGLPGVHRIWFYDVSAGPDYTTYNWNIDDYEIEDTPNGNMDYRIPPVWEYGNYSGYRPFINLTYDLALLTRLVAIDLLFTNHMTYNIFLPDQNLWPSEIEIDQNVFDYGAPFNVEDLIDPEVVVSSLEKLQPYNNFTYEMNSYDPPARLRMVSDAAFDKGSTSYGNRAFGDAFNDFWCYFNDHRLQYVDGFPDYEVPVFTLALPDGLYNEENIEFRGYAAGNVADYPVQEFVLMPVWPSLLERHGTGLTSVLVHEVGHHLGATHPHNGVDAEWGIWVAPGDSLVFVIAGDESNTVMSYLTVNSGSTAFSQFDIDNMNRWVSYGMLSDSNDALASILKSPRASKVNDLLIQADQFAMWSLFYFQAMQYNIAAEYANDCFKTIQEAAEKINVVLFPGYAPGTWGTRSYDRSPFLRQFLNSINRDYIDLITNDPINLPQPRKLEEILDGLLLP